MTDHKMCSHCRHVLPRQMFHRDSSRNDGHHYLCKACYKKVKRPYAKSVKQKALHRISRRREIQAEIWDPESLIKDLIQEYSNGTD